MAMNAEHRGGRSRWRIAVWFSVAALMLLPLFAKAAADGFAWDIGDFVFFYGLLLGIAVTSEVAARRTDDLAYLAGVTTALGTAVMLILVTGAVGIIGSEDDNPNLLYGGVLAVGIIGAVIARFRAIGMAHTFVATALAQALVAVIAIIAGWGSDADPEWPRDIVGVTALFVALWLAAAWLFWRATRRHRVRGATASAHTAD